MIDSGFENMTKFAKAIPNIFPVNSNTSFATSSPLMAASYTSLEVISSILVVLNKLGLSD